MALELCRPGVTTPIAAEGEGQSCAVIVAQAASDPGGWVVNLQAEGAAGYFLVRRLMVTPPFRGLSRVVATCTFPGARRWLATVQSPAGISVGMRVSLAAGDRPFAIGELDREDSGQPGSVGYRIATGLGAAAVVIPPGGKVKEISAIGDPGGTGSITVVVRRDAVVTATLGPIPLPAGGLLFDLPMRDIQGAWVASVTFANVVSHFVSWVE